MADENAIEELRDRMKNGDQAIAELKEQIAEVKTNLDEINAKVTQLQEERASEAGEESK